MRSPSRSSRPATIAIRQRFATSWSLRVNGPGIGSAASRADALSQPAREHSGSTATSQPAAAASSRARRSSARFAFLSPMATRTWPRPIRRRLRAMAARITSVPGGCEHCDPRHFRVDRVKEYPVTIAVYLLIIVLLLLLNAFFVLAEFAAIRMRPSRVEELVAQGNATAKLVHHLQSHLDDYLPVFQVGITMASIALGFVGQASAEEFVHNLLGVHSRAAS